MTGRMKPEIGGMTAYPVLSLPGKWIYEILVMFGLFI
jgi:hypothetical protein